MTPTSTARRLLAIIALAGMMSLSPGPACTQAADKAAISQAVVRGMRYLQANLAEHSGGSLVLAAYALLKSGAPPTDAHIQRALNEILTERIQNGKYDPGALNPGLYMSGVDAMLLVDIDPETYRPQLQMIAAYLMEKQVKNGSWDYRASGSNPDAKGDTSVTQYALLGLWAASRSGVDVPLSVWDRALMWHFRSQIEDGGFPYVPGSTEGVGRGTSTPNMTAAAVGSMTIAVMHLYPGQLPHLGATTTTTPQPPSQPAKKFGVLERRETSPNATPTGPFKPTSPFNEFSKRAGRGLGWFSSRFVPVSTVGWNMYYYYALERMAALNDIEQLGGVDWYNACSTSLLETQRTDGSWDRSQRDPSTGPYIIGTSFALLFLTRSTAKILNRLPREDPLGGGLLVGGRGLPDNLADVDLKHGRVQSDKPTSPLDELLRSLERSASGDLFEVQTQLVEQIQLGDREELIGQTERLIKLLDHSNAEVRRTALWALGRSDDLRLAKYAVAALEDSDVDVLVEAHNALCWMSRRPNAFGLPPNPVADLPRGTTDAKRNAAVESWRRKAIENWGKWYLRVCPYDQRYEPFAIDLAQKLGLR